MGKRKKGRANRKKAGVKTWRDLVFWRDLLFYYLFFSYFGHYVEMGWAWFCHLVLKFDLATYILANPLEPYSIYGMGAVLMILVVRPIAAKFKGRLVNTLAVFVVATLVCSALELTSSVLMVQMYGHNPFWWYADRPLNLCGHIWIGNCLLFGLLATVFLKLIYPLTEKFLMRVNKLVLWIMLGILGVMFVAYHVISWGIY